MMSPNQPIRRRSRHSISSLMLIILAVNMIPLGLLGLGIFYLDQYKQNLIAPAYKHMESELQLLTRLRNENPSAFANAAAQLDGMVIVIDEDGRVVESIQGAGMKEAALQTDRYANGMVETLASLLVWINPLQTDLPLFPELDNNVFDNFPEIKSAMQNRISVAAAWGQPDGFVLTVALPYQFSAGSRGVMMMVYDGTPIEAAIDGVRLDMMKVVIIVLMVTFLMSVYLSSFIAIPLKRLAQAAEAIRTGQAKNNEIPDLSARRDEIGELSIALRQMTQSLHKRIDMNERFAADVSHEIKNPLTSLRSAVETAMHVKKKEDRERLMDIIKSDVTRLDRMISDISHMTRLDTELARDSFTRVDLKNLLIELSDLWRHPMARGQDDTGDDYPAMIRLELPASNAYVLGRADSLAQVFQNLISNALSFNPPARPVEITLEVKREELTVQVKDHGPGLPEGRIEKIFERFYSDRPEAHGERGHSGLGLAIARQIMEAHHGALTAENHYDASGAIQGALFTVRLPSAA